MSLNPALSAPRVDAWKIAARLADGRVATIAILGLAALLQIRFGAFGDVSWLITVCEGWLDGKTPYVDLIETNPPPALWLYMPPVWAARVLHLAPELTVAAYGLGLAFAACSFVGALLGRSGLMPRKAPLFANILLVATTLLPGRTFDERDFFAFVFGLPYVALMAARASGAPAPRRDAWLAGLGAGAMIALKPPYAAICLLLALNAARRIGLRRALITPETLAVVAVELVAAAASWEWFPAYFSNVAPDVALAYLPVRETLATLTANAALVLALALGGLTITVTRPKLDAVAEAFLVAAVGAVVAYYAQGKGWLYHDYPALALCMIAFGAAIEQRARDPLALAAAGVVGVATVASALLFDASPIPVAALGAILARLLLLWLSSNDSRERLSPLAGGALIGAACGLYSLSFPGPAPEFTRAMLALSPHPTIASIGEGLGLGFPLTRNVDGRWTMRLQGMLMTAGARRLIDLDPHDEALQARLQPVIDRDRDRVAEDIVANRPDFLLVSEHGPRFHAWAMSDPKLSVARAPYRLLMSNPEKDWPVDLYVRGDLLPLRGEIGP